MTVRSLPNDGRRGYRTNFRRRSALCDGCEALEKADLAELSATAINNMTCDELARLIRVANLPAFFRSDLDEHLQFYDRTVLARLAHLAQRCCRNQEQRTLEADTD